MFPEPQTDAGILIHQDNNEFDDADDDDTAGR